MLVHLEAVYGPRWVGKAGLYVLPTYSLGPLSRKSSLQKKKSVASQRGEEAGEDLKMFGETLHVILVFNAVECGDITQVFRLIV